MGIALINRLKQMNLLHDMVNDGLNKCEVCVEDKFIRKSFKTVTNRVFELLELIHTDLADYKNLKS